MASQIITLPRPVFDTLVPIQAELRLELWKRELDIPWTSHRQIPESIPISAQVRAHGLGNRLVFRDVVLALVIVPEDVRPEKWPRPLPDDKTLKLLAALEDVISTSNSLTAHEVLRIAHAFDKARALPGIGPEPVVLRQPRTARLRRLRAQGLALSREFAERTAEIDGRLAPYAARTSTADLDQCIATLSAQAELGIRLRLQPGSAGTDSRLALLTTTRRNSLEDLMQVMACLAEATRHALERWAPHSAVHHDKPGIKDLEPLVPSVNGNAWSAYHSPWRVEDRPNLGLGSPIGLASPVPASAVLAATKRWMTEFGAQDWVGVHPLIWNAIAHLEFIRINPFLHGNRRIARILFEALLHRAGWPVLPWQLGFERRRDDYLDALYASFTNRSYRPIVELVLQLFDPVLGAGQRMLEVLPPERARLEAIIPEQEFPNHSEREYADVLIGQILVEGIGWGLKNDRPLLKRLHEQGLIDRIRTPAGAVFSSSVARELLRQSEASRQQSEEGRSAEGPMQ